MNVSNIENCNPQEMLFIFLYVPFSLLSLFILIFSVVKIFLNLRKSDEPDDEYSKVFKKKLFILEFIKAFEIFLYPLNFLLSSILIIITVRVFPLLLFLSFFILMIKNSAKLYVKCFAAKREMFKNY